MHIPLEQQLPQRAQLRLRRQLWTLKMQRLHWCTGLWRLKRNFGGQQSGIASNAGCISRGAAAANTSSTPCGSCSTTSHDCGGAASSISTNDFGSSPSSAGLVPIVEIILAATKVTQIATTAADYRSSGCRRQLLGGEQV